MNDRNKVADLIAGLRGLADFYQEHPDAPIPPSGTFRVDTWAYSKKQLADAAKIMMPCEKKYSSELFFLRKKFGEAVQLDVNIARDQVCRRVVTGQRVVQAQPAVPEHVVDVVEWRCEDPILEGGKDNGEE